MGVHPYRRPTAVEVNEYRRKETQRPPLQLVEGHIRGRRPSSVALSLPVAECGAQAEQTRPQQSGLFCFRFG